jgi:hypothetical protein
MTREACISDPVLISLLVASNLLIWIAYVWISLTITWVISRAPRVPFPAVWWLFAGFIFSCGGTHFAAVLVFFRPAFYLESVVCSITAIISVVTAVFLFRWRRMLLSALTDAHKLEHQISRATSQMETIAVNGGTK